MAKKRTKATSEPTTLSEEQPALRLEWRSPAELAENPANWRRHPEAQVNALTDVLSEVGWAGACLFNERTQRLIDGHARRRVALEQGAEKVPVLVGNWTEEQEAKILATLDPIASMAEADKDRLDALLRDVHTGSEALQQMLTDLAEKSGVIPGMQTPTPGAGGDEFDAGQALEGECRVKPGELWTIGGKHRLICGDSTDAATVGRLMGGEKAALCLTDPPYGIGEAYASHHDSEENLAKLIAGFLPVARAVSTTVLLTPGNMHHRAYPAPDWTLAWACPAGTGCGPWGFCCWQPVLAYGKDPYLSRGLGSRPDFLNKSEGADNSLGHPCSKPIGVWAWFMERGSVDEGDIVYDPFLGSGTTLIAAHRLNRRCFGCEIEPRYCSVILARAEAEGLSVEKA